MSPRSVSHPLRRCMISATWLLAAAALPLAGCSAKPENSPVIRKKFAEVDQMKQEVEDTRGAVQTAAADLQIIKGQMNNLLAVTPNADGVVKVLDRLDALEARLKQIESNGAAVTNVANATTPRNSDTPAAPANGAPTVLQTTAGGVNPLLASPPSVTREGESTEASPSTAVSSNVPADVFPRLNGRSTTASAPKPAAATKPETKPAAQPAKPKPATASASANRGGYYTLKAGDTLETIASSNGLAVEDLKKANRLPEGARLFAGQRLFLPGKAN